MAEALIRYAGLRGVQSPAQMSRNPLPSQTMQSSQIDFALYQLKDQVRHERHTTHYTFPGDQMGERANVFQCPCLARGDSFVL